MNFAAPAVLFGTQFRYPWLVTAAMIGHACLFFAIVVPACGWLGAVATRFHPRGREVWLTIDDGPDGESSLQLADALAQRGVPATFFVKGQRLARQSEVAHHLLRAGHSLANHTQTHPAHLFWWLWPARLQAEIDACDEALRGVGVAVCRWFRSPVGLKNIFLEPALLRRRMRCVGWSVSGRDGLNCEPELVARRVAGRISPGSIILLHECREHSNEAILRVTDELRALGFSFVIPEDEQLF